MTLAIRIQAFRNNLTEITQPNEIEVMHTHTYVYVCISFSLLKFYSHFYQLVYYVLRQRGEHLFQSYYLLRLKGI